jgi:hypothetical protein
MRAGSARAFLDWLLAWSLVSAPAAAVDLAEWDLAGANADVSDVVQVASEVAHVSAQPLTAQGDLQPSFDRESTFLYAGWPTGQTPDPTKYFEFSIAPDPGFSVQYESLSLAVASGGSGTGAFQIRTRRTATRGAT